MRRMSVRNLPIRYRPGFGDWDDEWATSLRGQQLGVYGTRVADHVAGLVAGDTRELLIYPIVPALRSGAARTVSTAWLTIKASQTAADATANATWTSSGGMQSITTTNNVGIGQILSASTPELRFDLTAANTVNLTARRTYYFDCQMKMNDGAIYTVERGRFETGQQITIATS